MSVQCVVGPGLAGSHRVILADTPPLGGLPLFICGLVVMGQMNSGVPSCYKLDGQDSAVLYSRVWSRKSSA